MRAAAFFLMIIASPALAQGVVTSPAPSRVEVTVYRDLGRGNAPLERGWLNGYALISETRTLAIPAGESELRFEGVASGIIPQSTIVSGIPEGLLERNRDALLLSAGSLVDRALGQRVRLRRTDAASGKVTEQEAVVRTGSNGGVLLQTAAGIEALRCTGLAETLIHERGPAGLSAKPTLSVRVRARQALNATVTLSYLATGFDWQADYVAMLSPDERRLQLQAWLTLASTDDTSFVGATTQAVAGRVNREQADVPPAEAPPLRLSCWPQGTTSDIESATPVTAVTSFDLAVPAPPPPPPPPAAQRSEIVVTGSRITAQREQLGDLQLYRIPEPVTVAANAQKQVGLLDQPAVRVTPVYRLAFNAGEAGADSTAQLILKTRNRASEGLGLPLPAGNVIVLLEGASRPVLIGEGQVEDHAVGEEVELRLRDSAGVRGRLRGNGEGRFDLTVTNDRAMPVQVEVQLMGDGERMIHADTGLLRRDDRRDWVVTIPANGSRTLTYRLGRAS
jgi:hypothetical protein